MKRPRPETPRVIIGENFSGPGARGGANAQNEALFKNFSNFMRQIVDSDNGKFLNGDINVIDYVLAKYLKMNITDLQNLQKLTIRINGSYGLLNQFGQRLVNLKFLKLNDSFIQSIDDLGTNFRNLKILQINNCKLKDLTGIICFEQLEILEAKNNEISDLIELEMSTSIKKLNLENNLIENEENIYFLSSLDNLEYVNLLGNPIKNYEKKLKEILPNLKEVDVQKDICDEIDLYNDTIKSSSEVKKEDNKSKIINTKKEETKDNNSINTSESTKLSTSMDIKKGENGENDNVEIVDNNNNIIQELMESKTKFDFKKSSINDLRPAKDLKPVIAKKKESKEIKILRETFSRESQKNDLSKSGVTINNDINSSRYKNNIFSSGLKTLKDMKGKKEKIVITSKNTNSGTNSKNDKFFEELKMRRMMGNK
jgi:hypothetical protein